VTGGGSHGLFGSVSHSSPSYLNKYTRQELVCLKGSRGKGFGGTPHKLIFVQDLLSKKTMIIIKEEAREHIKLVGRRS